MDEDSPQAPLNSNVQTNQSSIPALVDNVTSQFIVVPTGSPTTIGVSGFIFDIIGNEEMMLDSEITDHYTEDNTSVQDQIALRPEQFTLGGYVGELVYDLPNPFTDILTALSVLASVPGISPVFQIQDSQNYSQLSLVTNSVASIINTAQNIYSLFSGYSTTATKQQNAFQYFYNLWLSRTLCEVETPWGILQNMAILSVRAKQDEITKLVSDFSVTFKAMRFASTSTTTSTGANLSSTAGRSTQVLQGTDNATNSGSTTGTVIDNSVLSQAGTNLASDGGN